MKTLDNPIHPTIIQGGMGVAISNWRLAKAVSQHGQLGVVSGTGLDNVLIRRLQDGDADGHIQEALAAFPNQALVTPILLQYLGTKKNAYQVAPLQTGLETAKAGILSVLGGFVEVWLAKQGHAGKVGINLLTKIQTQALPTLYGALLAKVDYVLMGAGIPRDFPEILELLCQGNTAKLKLEVTGAQKDESFMLEFDPSQILNPPPVLPQPNFLPIIASNVLATMLARKCGTGITGFIVEAPTAGGHNAPPRGEIQLDELGQPIYGTRDNVDLEQLKALGYPFWLAGGTGSPDILKQALEQGANGIQVGTLFAYCQESGFAPEIKHAVLEQIQNDSVQILTDPRASPTGFPFKVVNVPNTLSESTIFETRARICDLGYLREAYRLEDGNVGYRCASEPVITYLKKGGQLEDTIGRKCLCNSLMASADYPQTRGVNLEPALVTSGDELLHMNDFLERYGMYYTATDVVQYLTDVS
jgi:NAD(P)H-dependent flavin oxidoreductase YrpB (nitropropane dioxygenase family)